MFRNLLTMAMIGTSIALAFGHPETWNWPEKISSQFHEGFKFTLTLQPLVSIVLVFLAVALQMAKKLY